MQKQLINWNQNKTQLLVFGLIGFYVLLFLPFWKPVLMAFLFAAALEPVVNIARQRLHARRTRVAYATVALGLGLIIAFVSSVVLQGYSQIYDLFKDPSAMGNLNEKINGVKDTFVTWAGQQRYLSSINMDAQLDRAVTGFTNTGRAVLLRGAQEFVSQTPSIVLNLFIFIVMFAAYLVIQPRIWASTSQALGLGETGKEHFKRFEKICGLALGSILLTGLIQTILVTIGAAIAGYDSLMMIFGITFIFAMIPLLGAGLVPAFLCVLSFIQGDMKTGIVMLVTAVIVGIADNIIRGWLFSRAAKTNPVISIVSLLGGIALLGFIGLFIAPVVEQLVMTYAFSEEGEPKSHQITAKDNLKNPDHFVSSSKPGSNDMHPHAT